MRNMMKWLPSSAAGLVLCFGTLALSGGQKSDGSPKNQANLFAGKIAPLLQERCLKCHGDKRPRGGLDLTTREHLMKGGDTGSAVIPGKASESLLYKMVAGPKPSMPRRGKHLTAGELGSLRQWINGGAVWPKKFVLRANAPSRNEALTWWSLRPLKRSALPKVKNQKWVRTPIDAFILAKLEELSMSPAPEVDRRTFLRRVKFDLHGLPPTPQEIRQFLTDTSPDAFGRLIDRLLNDPLYGERWGRHWLDIIHYADTHGFDKDKVRLWAWLFRDWIIEAFNEDMPYRRFVRMQLAGDVVDPDTPEGIIATGFVVAGPWDFVGHVELREGTVEKMKTRLLDRDDMVANTMSTFVSVTAHCARCHDHQFDPIPQKEYYQLQAVFAGVERGDRTFVTRAARQKLAALQKQKQSALARRAAWQRQIQKLTSPELVRLDAELKTMKDQLSRLPKPAPGKASPTNGYHSRIERKQNVTKWVQVDLGKSMPIDEIRLIPARPTDFRDSPGFGFPLRFRVEIGDDPKFGKATTLRDHTKADFPNPGDKPILLHGNGKSARFVRVTANKLWLRRNDYIFALAELQVDSGGKNEALGAKVTALDSIEAGRWSRKNLVDNYNSRHLLPDLSNPKIAEKIRRRNDLLARIQKTDLQRRKLADALIPKKVRTGLAKTNALLALLDDRMKRLGTAGKVYAVRPIAPRPIYVLHRGNVEKRKEKVAPGSLSLMPEFGGKLDVDNPQIEGQRRLALANWIVDKRNVLAWRSIVNRVWQYHFGRGLVDTPNDFGKNGSQPTHPELLDWLAVEFRDNGQSFKKLHKMILLSSAYRQSTKHNEAIAKKNADNRYLWRMNRRKLDAEAVRDSVLAVSGKLDFTRGGPGFRLFRFKDDHSPHYNYNAPEIINDPKTFRRTVYRFIVRSVGNPFLESLDCADPNISVPKRNKTLTALQALALLNNPFMVKQSAYFAERLRKYSNNPAKQIERAYVLALGRRPSPEETKVLAAYTRRHGLANMCRLLFNTNEFVFVD